MNIMQRISTEDGVLEFLKQKGTTYGQFCNMCEELNFKQIAKKLHTSPNVVTGICKTMQIDTKAIRGRKVGEITARRFANMTDEEKAKDSARRSEALYAFYDSETEEHKDARRSACIAAYANMPKEQKELISKKIANSVSKHWSQMTDEQYATRCKAIKNGRTDASKKECSHKLSTRYKQMSEEQKRQRMTNSGFVGEARSNRLARLCLDSLHIAYDAEYLVHVPNTHKNYRLDFYLVGRNIDLEIDGSIHKRPQRQVADKERDDYMHSIGLQVVRIQYDGKNVETYDTMMHKLTQALGMAGC